VRVRDRRPLRGRVGHRARRVHRPREGAAGPGAAAGEGAGDRRDPPRTFTKMWNSLVQTGDPGLKILHAYLVKEDLRALLALSGTNPERHLLRARLDTFYCRAAASSSPEVHRLATTIETWWPAIEASVTTGYSNARSARLLDRPGLRHGAGLPLQPAGGCRRGGRPRRRSGSLHGLPGGPVEGRPTRGCLRTRFRPRAVLARADGDPHPLVARTPRSLRPVAGVAAGASACARGHPTSCHAPRPDDRFASVTSAVEPLFCMSSTVDSAHGLRIGELARQADVSVRSLRCHR